MHTGHLPTTTHVVVATSLVDNQPTLLGPQPSKQPLPPAITQLAGLSGPIQTGHEDSDPSNNIKHTQTWYSLFPLIPTPHTTTRTLLIINSCPCTSQLPISVPPTDHFALLPTVCALHPWMRLVRKGL